MARTSLWPTALYATRSQHEKTHNATWVEPFNHSKWEAWWILMWLLKIMNLSLNFFESLFHFWKNQRAEQPNKQLNFQEKMASPKSWNHGSESVRPWDYVLHWSADWRHPAPVEIGNGATWVRTSYMRFKSEVQKSKVKTCNLKNATQKMILTYFEIIPRSLQFAESTYLLNQTENDVEAMVLDGSLAESSLTGYRYRVSTFLIISWILLFSYFG